MSANQSTLDTAAAELKSKLDIAAKVLGAQEIPSDVLEMVRAQCNLTHEQLADVLDAIKSGVRNSAEYFGVTPAVANTIEAMALEFYRQKHITYAHCLYAFLVELDIKRATAWRGMGACHQVQRMYPLAVLCYQNALALDHNDVVSTVFLGECLFIDGWHVEGIRTLELAVAMGSKIPAQAFYVKRARAILDAQGGAAAAPQKKSNAAAFDIGASGDPALVDAPAKPAGAPMGGHALGGLEGVDVQGLLAMDQLEFSRHPEIYALAQRLQLRLRRREITFKDVAGFTEEQMYGGYAAACRLIDVGQPLKAMEIMGWMLYFDSRNGSYYQVAGLAAHHAKLYCFADYMYAMSLIYDKNNPVTMLYQGEVKIYSFERHAGVELLRKAVEMLQRDPQQANLVKRGKALIKQFEKKPANQQNTSGVGPK